MNLVPLNRSGDLEVNPEGILRNGAVRNGGLEVTHTVLVLQVIVLLIAQWIIQAILVLCMDELDVMVFGDLGDLQKDL